MNQHMLYQIEQLRVSTSTLHVFVCIKVFKMSANKLKYQPIFRLFGTTIYKEWWKV